MIVVFGSGGLVGAEVVRTLAAKGEKVRAVVRNLGPGEKEDDFEVLARLTRHPKTDGLQGVEQVPGDVSQPGSWAAALKGAERLFLIAPSTPEQVEQETGVLEEARRAGVRHVVRWSQLGASKDSPSPFHRWHGQCEAHLEASGMTFTHLRVNVLMQSLLYAAPAVAAMGGIPFAAADWRFSILDARDAAQVAAAALVDPQYKNRALELTGPESLDYHQMTAQLSEAMGRTVVYMPASRESFAEALTGFGEPAWKVEAMVNFTPPEGDPQAAEVLPTVSEVLERPARRFADFARENVGVFERGES